MSLKEASNQIKELLDALPVKTTDRERLMLTAKIKILVEDIEEPFKKRRDKEETRCKIIKKALKQFIRAIDGIIEKHEEVGDTDVREKMTEAIYKGFIRPQANYKLPTEFGMFSEQANKLVHTAIRKFLTHPEVVAAHKSLKTPEARLTAFQDFDVESPDGITIFEYFGWSNKPRTY